MSPSQLSQRWLATLCRCLNTNDSSKIVRKNSVRASYFLLIFWAQAAEVLAKEGVSAEVSCL